MARAARLGTKGVAVPLLTSHFHVMEARALARINEQNACDRAMDAAIENFERHVPGEAPSWIDYFDAAELSAELSHCHRDLGRCDRAIQYATKALDAASGDYVRSDFFAAMVLADAHLDRGDLEEGCRVAGQAMTIGEALDSVRCRSYVNEFRQRLTRHASSSQARDLVSQIRASRLWSAADGNGQ